MSKHATREDVYLATLTYHCFDCVRDMLLLCPHLAVAFNRRVVPVLDMLYKETTNGGEMEQLATIFEAIAATIRDAAQGAKPPAERSEK